MWSWRQLQKNVQVGDRIFADISLCPAPRPGRVMVLICMYVCWCVCMPVCMCLSAPPFRYHLKALDLQVPFESLGPLGTFWKPQNLRYILDTLNLQVPFGYLEPWIFRYLLQTLELQLPFPTLDLQVPFANHGPLSTICQT